jgi:uncharacterized delta-60 repeat protein
MCPASPRRRASESGAARAPSGFARARAFSAAALVTSLLAAAPAQATPGDLDPTFSGDGKVVTDFGGSDNGADIAVQPDGKIVVVGTAARDVALVRYNADGSLDSSFAGDGKQITAIPFNSEDWLSDVAIRPDGWLVVVGSAAEFNICGCTDLVVGHYTPDGSSAGLPLTRVSGTDYAPGVALQPDGKIVVAGSALSDGRGDFLLARYNTTGSPDATFSDDGIQTTDFGGSDGAGDVAVQADGKIVAVGQAIAAGQVAGDVALARHEGGSVSGTAPVNATPPTISGTATEGQTLTVSAGAWTGSTPIDDSYQWRRCDSAGANCVDISAATGTTYTLTVADVGRTIRVRETATNAYGAGSADSAATAAVKAKPGVIAGAVLSKGPKAGIPSASVSCGPGYSATTTTDGSYSIPNVAPGTYSCTASANGYRPSTQPVRMPPSSATVTANFSLRR